MAACVGRWKPEVGHRPRRRRAGEPQGDEQQRGQDERGPDQVRDREPVGK
jgi:hypothetical protein